MTGEQTIEAWASDASRHPEELGGTLAELARCASRAFLELFGCDCAPERVKGAAYMLLEKIPSHEGTCFAVRPGLVRAMAELGLLDPLVSALERGRGREAHASAAHGLAPLEAAA